MKIVGVSAAVAVVLAAPVFAGGSRDNQTQGAAATNNDKVVEQTVYVTGSLIPERIKVRRVGTTTFSPLRVIDRREIDQTGRVTTAGAFVNDPSVRIIGH